MYGLLRQLYAKFYGSLGASPEEVGLGYQQVLALSGVALLAFALIAGAVFLLRFPLRHVKVIKKRPRPWVAIGRASLSALFVVGGTWWLDVQAGDSATRAYHGHAVTSVNIAGLQVLGLRAEPATIQWYQKPPLGEDTISGRCLMYLGVADGVDVFFDPGPGKLRTIRLQASEIVVTTFRGVANQGPGEGTACLQGTPVGGNGPP
ncbi:MAG: hypothetical protein JF887_05865 [Candidatus Dormibacteraeota bacterium]|uniref:Uncharacterized protein n=1 Tax=Candidatus Amunia macphersoniae TaxID=3127014 RepID=A0A934KPP7_9BACT|nr:hypothetical protein [Candidatus Dormibacteraeota bacterium]